MKKVIILFLVLMLVGCTGNIKEEARYIKHSEIVNNFDKYNGELVKVEGVAWVDEGYESGEDFMLLNIVDGDYTAHVITGTNYNVYNGESLIVYGKINAVSKEGMFYEVKAVRIDAKEIEQGQASEELKNDILIQEFVR